MTQRDPPAARSITPRRFLAGLRPGELPPYWHQDNVVSTSACEAMALVFPEGERFFVRSVRAFQDPITDPALRAQVRAFIQQEAQHGAAHEATFAHLRAQGLPIDGWLARYRWLAYRVIEPASPPILRLSVTVALEHLTASLGQATLREGLMDGAHPEMAALMRWHAAEEIEHKAVAFEVLQAVDGRYLVRVAGMVIGLSTFLAFWTSAIRFLRQHDPERARRWAADRDRLRASGLPDTRWRLVRSALDYLRPGFHPDQVDDAELAAAALAELALPAA
jgi:hypothetical protein